jgi:hypothetical protein
VPYIFSTTNLLKTMTTALISNEHRAVSTFFKTRGVLTLVDR